MSARHFQKNPSLSNQFLAQWSLQIVSGFQNYKQTCVKIVRATIKDFHEEYVRDSTITQFKCHQLTKILE